MHLDHIIIKLIIKKNVIPNGSITLDNFKCNIILKLTSESEFIGEYLW